MRLLNPQARHKVLLLAALIVAAGAYFPLNRAASHGHVLATALDRYLPLVPVMAIPYLLFLPVFCLAVLYALSTKHFTQLALAAIVFFVCSDVVYLLFTTRMPRPTLSGSGVAESLMRFIYSHDRPFNDFPSGHAGAATLFILYSRTFRRPWQLLAVLFGCLVIAATVFTKQHSILGALGGVALAGASWFGVRQLTSRKTLS